MSSHNTSRLHIKSFSSESIPACSKFFKLCSTFSHLDCCVKITPTITQNVRDCGHQKGSREVCKCPTFLSKHSNSKLLFMQCPDKESFFVIKDTKLMSFHTPALFNVYNNHLKNFFTFFRNIKAGWKSC